MKTRNFIILIFIAGFIVYFNSLFNSFLWDDEEQIVNNVMLQDLRNLPLLFYSSTFNTGGAPTLTGLYYKPLMPLSFMLNHAFWKVTPFGFHLFQLLLHLGNAALVFLLLRHLFSLEKPKIADTLAFLAALFFVVHPGISEAVVYISATQEVLYTFFGLLAFLLVTRLTPKDTKRFALILFLLLLALLSKESGFTFIPIIFAYLFLFKKEWLLKWLVGSLTVVLFYLFLRFGVAKIGFLHLKIIPIAAASLSERLKTVPFEIFSYLRLFIFPKDLFIAQHQVVKSFSDPRFWTSLLTLLPLTALLIFLYFRKPSRLFLFFASWIFFSLGLVLNIFPLDMTVAERWLYFPLAGFLGLSFLLLSQATQDRGRYLLVIILLLFSFRTILRTFDWRNGLSLFSHDIKLNSQAFDLQNNFGVELFRAGRVDETLSHFEKSITLAPAWWTSYNNAGAVYQRAGDLEKARYYYEKSIENGDYYLAYENLAFLLLKTEAPETVLVFLKPALGKLPNNSKLNQAAALAHYKRDDQEKALFFARKALLLAPTYENQVIYQAILNKKPLEF